MEGLILDPATRRERIEAGPVTLRRARWDDLPGLHRALSDPATMRYWATPPHPDLAASRDWLANMIEADPAISDDFVIDLGGEAIGKLGTYVLPDIGYLIGPGHAGKGYASAAIAAFIGYIRARGLPRLTADVDPRNAASIALLRGAGFTQTGSAARTWLVGGEWCDSLYFALDLNPAA